VVGRAASVLAERRGAAFVGLFACVLAWFIAAPHLPHPGLWPDIVIVSVAVLPATLLLVYLALPLSGTGWRPLLAATAILTVLAFVFSVVDWGLPANFAKLWAAVAAGWTFLTLFEELSWVVIVAVVVPFVDAISVWRGPTHAITAHHFGVYTAVAIAFLVPGGGAAYLGPPDVLFFALFLSAARRWSLRVGWTWIGATAMYGLTIVIANAANVGGLPALPFLSVGFLAANGDLLWARLRRPAASS
jgi:hypothetical protein